MVSFVKIQTNLTDLKGFTCQTTVFSEGIFSRCDIVINEVVEAMFDTLFNCGFVFLISHGIMM